MSDVETPERDWSDKYCKECDKEFSSMSNLFVHKREKHTFYNTRDINCECCLKLFYSVIFNNQKDIYYTKCEECRNLQNLLKTRGEDLKHGKYVYGLNNNRYYIDSGVAVEVCKMYDCFGDINCNKHDQLIFTVCKSTKCNNCFVRNGCNYCERCRDKNDKSKNKLRNHVKEFKLKLGGKCVDCNSGDLFSLEFDHIDPKKKTVQITRSKPSDWINEESNLELRCSICHRIKTDNDREDIYKDNRNYKCKLDKKLFVQSIKKEIGKCQICNWTIDDKDEMCCALDFDHINDKYKQVSRLYLCSKEKIAEEIKKCRLICRIDHEMYTCLQRGGKKMSHYYTEEEIENIRKKLFDKDLQKIHNEEVINVLKKLGY